MVLLAARSLNVFRPSLKRSFGAKFTRVALLSTTVDKAVNLRPWYVEDNKSVPLPQNATQVHNLESFKSVATPPPDAPEYLKLLFTELQTSPFIEQKSIRLSQPIERYLAPPQAISRPKGRRKRGGSDHGPSVGSEPHGQLWSWLLLIQVKEGTEGRGAVEHVARIARNAVAKSNPSVLLPSKKASRSRDTSDPWAMLDLGDHVIHILSKSAREKWFSDFYADMHLSQDAPYNHSSFPF